MSNTNVLILYLMCTTIVSYLYIVAVCVGEINIFIWNKPTKILSLLVIMIIILFWNYIKKYIDNGKT